MRLGLPGTHEAGRHADQQVTSKLGRVREAATFVPQCTVTERGTRRKQG